MDADILELCDRYCIQWCFNGFVDASLCKEMADLLDTLTNEQQCKLGNFLEKRIFEISKNVPKKQWPTFITPSLCDFKED